MWFFFFFLKFKRGSETRETKDINRARRVRTYGYGELQQLVVVKL